MRTLLLFGNDIRTYDSSILELASHAKSLHCLYIVDPNLFKQGRYQQPSLSPKRWMFLAEGLSDLNTSLNTLGQWLDIQYGDWLKTLAHNIKQLSIEQIILSNPVGYDESSRLAELIDRFPNLNIRCLESFTLFDQAQSNDLHQSLAKHFTPFRQRVENLEVPTPKSAVTHLPPPIQEEREFFLLGDAQAVQVYSAQKRAAQGGESVALLHVNHYFDSSAPSSYKNTRNALSDWSASSKCSFWLSQGALSPRVLWHATLHYEEQHGKNDGCSWLRVELLWREYFQWLSRKNGNRLFTLKGLTEQIPATHFCPHQFRAWCDGETAYPLINAIMKELISTGFISNRARQLAASALIHELECDWRYGAAWFEQHLLDYDVASNWGNWQYIAGVGADPRGGRHFNIDKQSKLYDPNLEYQKKWLG
jgi:deoxyribodipyrimidine photo-lyase